MLTRIVEVRRNILKKNDLAAARLRQRFEEAGLFVASFVSSPGAGKTAFLERTLAMVGGRRSVAALVGDLATEHDAEGLRRSGAPVRQITTGTVCHLDAEMVEREVNAWMPAGLEWLFIENVGNLVCPASYDLGECVRAVLLSVTEGEEKPLKYPTIFNTADVAIVTKIDLAQAVRFDHAALLENIERVRPGMPVPAASARTAYWMSTWIALVARQIAEMRARRDTCAPPPDETTKTDEQFSYKTSTAISAASPVASPRGSG